MSRRRAAVGTGVVLVAIFVPAFGACGGDTKPKCPDTVDAWLEKAGLVIQQRMDCGSFNAAQSEVKEGLDCFSSAVKAKRPAQLTVNNCIDCIESVTLVAIDGKTYVLNGHNDPYSNEHPPDTVETCDAIVGGTGLGPVKCSGGKQLYSCQS